MSRPLVLKFGGSSLAGAARLRRAARRIHSHRRRGRPVVAVVSAAGGTTDRLLARVTAIGPPDLRPDSAASSEPSSGSGAAAARAREVDRLLATGEDRSAALLAVALWRLGVPARSLRGGEAGVRADGAFGGGRIHHVAPAAVRRLLDDGVVPVISGFQAARDDEETVTLGRGGSDTTAVALAAALEADCHIVTDVEAVCDRDPARDPDARPLAALSHAQLVALVERGAQVVHPEAARRAAAARVPLRVYHFAARPHAEGGTRIGDAGHAAAPAGAGRCAVSGGGR